MLVCTLGALFLVGALAEDTVVRPANLPSELWVWMDTLICGLWRV
jgi:hypothetical protein